MRLLAALIGFALLSRACPALASDAYPHSKLFKSTRALIAQARAEGASDFGIVIASAPGKNAEVIAAIEAAHGHVDRHVDMVDYIRARVPLDRVESIADLPIVTAIDADAEITELDIRNGSRGETGTETPATRTSPTPKAARSAADDAPLLHPYLPGGDIGTLALRRMHPTFDGRGTTIALIDGTPDFLSPSLQVAKDLQGREIPKIVDIETMTDADTYRPDVSRWISMRTTVQTKAGAFRFDGVEYIAPHDGRFRLGFIHNTPVFSELVDPNARPKPKKGARLFAMLWDEGSNTVWVDTNGDRDFRNDRPLTDFASHRDFSTFDVHVDDQLARPTIGFAVQTDRSRHSIAILLGDADHGTGAAGSAVGAGLNNGAYDNIAPAARLVSIEPDYTSHSLIEAVIKAEQDPRVDIVCLESTSAESYGFKDGRFTQSVIYERLTRKYNKPILQPADNVQGLSQVEEAGVPGDVVSVGAYQSKESYRIDWGIDVPNRDNLHFVSAFGPTNNGGFKPTILAPSGYVSVDTGFADAPALKGAYDLPPGYQMFSGTSQATPTAAGAIAILMSAAKQNGIEFSVPHLIKALQDTARFLPGIPAYQQGPGLIRVDRAYAEMVRLDKHEPDVVTIDAPVRTIVSRYLPTPNDGTGLFEREGWTAGMRATRDLLLVRHTGGSGDKRFRLQVMGDDGTFTLPSSTLLRLGVARTVPVAIAAVTAGVHSAVLRVIDARSGEVVANAYLCIVAADRLARSDDYTASRQIAVPRPGAASAFIDVPLGAPALEVTYRVSRPLITSTFLPDSTDADAPTNFYLGNSQLQPGTATFVYPHPSPGVWELELIDDNDVFKYDNKQPHPVRPTTAVIKAAILGSSMSGDGGVFEARSTFAPMPDAIFARDTASIAEHGGALREGQQTVYTIKVPHGATNVGASVTSEDGDDIDLYLIDCTKRCHLRYRTTHYDGHNEAFVESPAAGTWKVVIDAFAVRGAVTRFHYLDYVSAPGIALRPYPGRFIGELLAVSVYAVDMQLYDNEPYIGGPVTPRKGMNPIMVIASPQRR